MSHIKTKTSRIGNRLVKSAASSALALSAIAGGIMVSGQSASAITVCPGTGMGSVGPVPGPATVSIMIDPECPTPPATEVSEVKVELQNPFKDLYDVDYDFTADLTTPGTYKFGYFLTSDKDPFIKAQLDSNVTLVSGPDITITKEIFADKGGASLLTLVSTNGSQTGFQSFGPDGSIYVIDTVVIPDGTSGVVDNFRNSYQTPGPLPILGAGAAFGFSRKLRSRIKASRLA